MINYGQTKGSMVLPRLGSEPQFSSSYSEGVEVSIKIAHFACFRFISQMKNSDICPE